MVLRADPWLSVQRSLMEGLRGTYVDLGIGHRVTSCKAAYPLFYDSGYLLLSYLKAKKPKVVILCKFIYFIYCDRIHSTVLKHKFLTPNLGESPIWIVE